MIRKNNEVALFVWFCLIVSFIGYEQALAGTVSCASPTGAFSRDDIAEVHIKSIGTFVLVRLITDSSLRSTTSTKGANNKLAHEVSPTSNMTAVELAHLISSTGSCNFDQVTINTEVDVGVTPHR